MSSNTMSAATLKTSIYAGIAGATLAVLFTPKSGHDIRQNIQNGVSKLHNRLSGTQHQLTATDRAEQLQSYQEEMRIKRDEKRQTPILSNWEQEL